MAGAERRAPTDPGDLAPDFWLPNAAGEMARFADRFNGTAVVLLIHPGWMDEAGGRELVGCLDRLADLEAAGARLVAVSPDAPATNAELIAERGLDASAETGTTLFTDPQGAITRGYGVGEDETRAFVIDRDQRILAALDGEGVAERALAVLREAAAQWGRAEPAALQAPVLVLRRVYDADLCRRIIRSWEGDHREGEIRARHGEGDAQTRKVEHKLKKRLDHFPEGPLAQEMTQTLLRRAGPIMERVFHFTPVAAERFCVGAYDAGRGDYFRPHRDNSTKATAKRQFAVTLNLNDDYEGGGLRFPEFGERIYRAPAGGAVVFSCSLLHEATPVSRGRRFVALTFLYDARVAGQPRPQGPGAAP